MAYFLFVWDKEKSNEINPKKILINFLKGLNKTSTLLPISIQTNNTKINIPHFIYNINYIIYFIFSIPF
ncbi:hypothetical protein Z954_14385 [Clostridium botulinum C/D str. BKT2873]|nr:hypothetical protein Z952_14045 [Clostridium botulinum C/D str. BKT75002]KEI06025.1 hypothetical protein Z954_14385 [Clostridium botulinum C/D str. BKT2873]